jgi:hypothetical protein
MWYTILISLVVDFGGLLIVYLILRDRVRRATTVESRISEIRDEVSRLLVELNQATDRNIALMEDKITALNEGISTADKKIGLLRRETEKHDVGSQIYSRLAEGRYPRAEQGAVAAAAGAEGSDDEQPGPPHGAERARRARTVPDAPRPAAARPAARPMVEQREPMVEQREPAAPPLAVELSGTAAPDARQRVMMLFRAGFSPSLIASRVGAPVGEVELIISLEQRKGQA